MIEQILRHLCRVPALPSRRRRHRRSGRRSGRLVKLKFYLSHCSASTRSGHGSFLGSRVPRRFLDPVDACLVPVVGFEALRPRRPCPLRLNMHRQYLRNLRPLCQVSRLVEAHAPAPAPVRIGLQKDAHSMKRLQACLRDIKAWLALNFFNFNEKKTEVMVFGPSGSSRCLQASYFPDDHTGENIAAGLREGLASWDLQEDNHICITTDNASNMVMAAQINEWTRLQCFGHRLHLAIGHALKDDRVSRAIGLCKKLVGHFSHSWKKKAAMTEAQRELKLPEHSLITECPTRWGSKEMMIARVLEQLKAQISQVLSGDRYARSLISTWQDIEVLESIHKALHPLLDFTDALSGEEYVSISYLKPVLNLLATSVLAQDQDDTDLTRSIKTKVLTYLNNKYSDPSIQELLDVASFLDPRFKTQYITAENIPIIKTRLKTEMLESARRAYNQEKRCRTETTPRPQNELPSGEKVKKSLGSFFKTAAASSASPVQPEDVAEAELNSYLMTPAIDREDDPLAWWKVHKINFPRLCNMARKYLCPCHKCSFRASFQCWWEYSDLYSLVFETSKG
ncbi:hypothetical protein MHYP_G00052990 [Metynnis hypsauchen]